MTRPCTGCQFHKRVHIAAHGEERDRCFRPKMMTDGTFQECGMKGFDAETERGDTPGPGGFPATSAARRHGIGGQVDDRG